MLTTCLQIGVTIIIFCLVMALKMQSDMVSSQDGYVATPDKDYDEKLKRRCLHRAFGDIILVLNFNFHLYKNIEIMMNLYEGVFGKIVICGPKPRSYMDGLGPDIEVNLGKGDFSYHCMGLAIEKYPGFKGYLYGNDDMIINWWTMVDLDRDKIWHGTQFVDFTQDAFSETLNNDWIWWKTFMGIRACQEYTNELKTLAKRDKTFKNYDIFIKNGKGRPRCGKGWSDFFYIPGELAKEFATLSRISFDNKLYLEIAVHNMLCSLKDSRDFIVLKGVYMPDIGHANYTAKAFWETYNHQVAFIHPYKFYAKHDHESRNLLKSEVIYFKQTLTDCRDTYKA